MEPQEFPPADDADECLTLKTTTGCDLIFEVESGELLILGHGASEVILSRADLSEISQKLREPRHAKLLRLLIHGAPSQVEDFN